MDEFDLPPDEFRRLALEAVDMAARHLSGLRDHPVFGKVGPDAPLFQQPMPETGRDAAAVLAFVRDHVLTHPFGSAHPRFFGFINATADPFAVVAELLAAAMNPNCWGGDHAAIHVELCALAWIAELLGLAPDAEGILTSGGSMANFTALGAARRAVCPDVREEGLPSVPRPVVYASDQTHNSVDKAVDLLGIGRRFLRRIETDEGFRIRIDSLSAAVEADRRAGLRPAIVVASAGTVNTGAVDPLDALADFCAREDLWLHVDGAYGAMAALVPSLAPLFSGLPRAHSLAADPHKWLYVPYDAGAVFVREKGRLSAAFARPAEYLVRDEGSPFNGPAFFADRGPELSRGFKALKVWMGLARHGRSGYAAAIEADVARARFLAEEVARRRGLELLAPPELSIVNFRVRPGARRPGEADLDALNRRIANRLVERGSFFLAPTVLRGRAWLRAALVNFRTTEADLSALLDEVEALAREAASAS